jgi:hypothetical protein
VPAGGLPALPPTIDAEIEIEEDEVTIEAAPVEQEHQDVVVQEDEEEESVEDWLKKLEAGEEPVAEQATEQPGGTTCRA